MIPGKVKYRELINFFTGSSKRNKLNELDKILVKYAWPVKVVADRVSVQEIETRAGFTFPEDYKYFLSKYRGHELSMKVEYFRLWNQNNWLT